MGIPASDEFFFCTFRAKLNSVPESRSMHHCIFPMDNGLRQIYSPVDCRRYPLRRVQKQAAVIYSIRARVHLSCFHLNLFIALNCHLNGLHVCQNGIRQISVGPMKISAATNNCRTLHSPWHLLYSPMDGRCVRNNCTRCARFN